MKKIKFLGVDIEIFACIQCQYITGGSYHSDKAIREILDRIHDTNSPNYEPTNPVYC